MKRSTYTWKPAILNTVRFWQERRFNPDNRPFYKAGLHIKAGDGKSSQWGVVQHNVSHNTCNLNYKLNIPYSYVLVTLL